MKNVRELLFLIVAMLPLAGHAQQISYSYDASGNRVARLIVSNSPFPSQGQQEKDDTSDTQHQTLSVGPNPTSGLLYVRLSVLGEDDNCRLLLSNMSGKVFVNRTVTSTESVLDLSTYQKGFYLLSVEINGKHNTYKIIKN